MDTLESLHRKIDEAEAEYQGRILSYADEHGQPPPSDILHQMEGELKQRLIAISTEE